MAVENAICAVLIRGLLAYQSCARCRIGKTPTIVLERRMLMSLTLEDWKSDSRYHDDFLGIEGRADLISYSDIYGGIETYLDGMWDGDKDEIREISKNIRILPVFKEPCGEYSKNRLMYRMNDIEIDFKDLVDEITENYLK